jgi:hypothetical protein
MSRCALPPQGTCVQSRRSASIMRRYSRKVEGACFLEPLTCGARRAARRAESHARLRGLRGGAGHSRARDEHDENERGGGGGGCGEGVSGGRRRHGRGRGSSRGDIQREQQRREGRRRGEKRGVQYLSLQKKISEFVFFLVFGRWAWGSHTPFFSRSRRWCWLPGHTTPPPCWGRGDARPGRTEGEKKPNKQTAATRRQRHRARIVSRARAVGEDKQARVVDMSCFPGKKKCCVRTSREGGGKKQDSFHHSYSRKKQ